MSLPDTRTAWAAIAATWPAASQTRVGPVTLRDGAGGGNRVSAATVDGAVDADELDAAIRAMRQGGRTPIFWIRDGEDALDRLLDELGFVARDHTRLMAAPMGELAARELRPLAAIPCEAPLAAMVEIWAAAGIGPARLAIMDRAPGPKTTFLGRFGDHPAGTCFAAISGATLCIHALEVAPAAQRNGVGSQLMIGAARWGASRGATSVTIAVTEENKVAQALYASLGFTVVGGYHYRRGPK